jgi:hypothetical protein
MLFPTTIVNLKTNKKMRRSIRIKTKLVIIALALISGFGNAQTLPYTFVNRSTYADNDIYIAIVGEIGGFVWVDPATGQVNQMSVSDNTVPGPVIEGNLGPGNNGLYAHCFRKLSDIPNKTVNIPKIAGCRIMMAFGSQLYLYFFGYSGSPSGYAAPNLANPTDPNQGIRYELIELTYNDNGLWCNTTRVDSYQYPIGLEVWGNGFYKKVGEILTHDEIISRWQSTAPTEFQGCLNASEGIIHFPSKTAAFQPGGIYAGFLDTYINNIWTKYSGQQLVFNSGQAGTWRGSVQGEAFVFTRDSDGKVATITRRPTQTEAMEGSGVLASGTDIDKVVEAQICAAINRHTIDLNIGSGVLQDFGNTSSYYQTWEYNWYCKFWHQTDLSYEGQTYSFCYDDVFDQSSTTHTSSPQSIKITLGGFSGIDNNPGTDDGETGLGGTYILENRKSGLVMDVAYGNPENGTNILQYYNTGTADQQFTLREVSSGVYSLICSATGKAVDVDAAGTENFANIQQWDYVGGANQLFKAEPAGDGYYKFKAVHSNKIIEVGHASTEENANINQYDDNDQICGQWKLIPVAGLWATKIEAESFSDQYGTQVEDCSEGGQNVGYIDAGDWLAYFNISFPVTGTYTVEYRVASLNGAELSLDLNAGTILLGAVTIPSTGGWQTWTTVKQTINIDAGTYNLGIYAPVAGTNINWIEITQGLKSSDETIVQKVSLDKVELFPNPANNILHLNGIECDAILEVYNITGRKLMSEKGNSISVEKLIPGMYFIHIINGQERICKRFMKN